MFWGGFGCFYGPQANWPLLMLSGCDLELLLKVVLLFSRMG